MAIQLPPSNDVNALVNAIETANATNQPLILLPGVHFTKPGYNVTIPIGPNGLNMVVLPPLEVSGPITLSEIIRYTGSTTTMASLWCRPDL